MAPRIASASLLGFVALAALTVIVFSGLPAAFVGWLIDGSPGSAAAADATAAAAGEGVSLAAAAAGVLAGVLVGVLVLSGVIAEWRVLGLPRQHALSVAVADAGSFLSVLAAAVLTYSLNTDMALGAVVASAVVGLLGAVVVKRFAAPVFCGSFVGMTSAALLPSLGAVAVAGTIAGVVFVLGKNSFNGFGGKLGTTALVGSAAAAVLFGRPFVGGSWTGVGTALIIIVACTLSAVATFVISIRLGHGPVIASAVVGLTAGLLLPRLLGSNPGVMVAVAVYCASFAGMSAAGRIKHEGWMALAGLLCAVVFVFTAPYLGGAGGKLGTIAFGSVIAVRALADLATARRRRAGAATAADRP